MKSIMITGDVTADWSIARIIRGPGEGNVWNDQDLTRACLQPGGAAMLGKLLTEMFKGRETDFQVNSVTLPDNLINPVDNRAYHSYVMWQAVEYPEKSKHYIWRVESFLGLDSYCGGDSLHCNIQVENDAAARADIVVIDDAGLQFRTNRDAWPKAILSGTPDWIIVKMSHPVAQEEKDGLWEHLLEHHAERTIVVTSIADLRKCSVRVSKGLSWERTALDLNWEFQHNPAIASLRRCAHVIVSIGTEGAFWLSNQQGKHSAKLLFDPLLMEGDWTSREKGYMLGYTVCLTAALAKQIAEASDFKNPQIEPGISLGLRLMRRLFREGFGPVYKNSGIMSSPQFPAESLASVKDVRPDHFCCREVPDPFQPPQEKGSDTKARGEWRILNEICMDREREYKNQNQRVPYRTDNNQELLRIATDTVIHGYEKVLKDVPLLDYGDLITADRQEIEDFHRVANSIKNYVKNPLNRPLCLAVFGAPGSGKSFGIKQVAKCVVPGKIQNIVFNLTQFTQNKDLTDALHQVRDIGLSGKIPLVFWDEFDTQGLNWLKVFLAPMQDGEFQDGQITYHIGKAIFAFAGGTSPTYERFGETLDKDNPQGEFRMLKGPDFLSRLHNILNVKGPNPVEGMEPDADFFIIRRAILLRKLLQRDAKYLFKEDILNIDPDVLRAFLKIKEYKHGARSMEAILAMSLTSGQRSLDKSSLPPLAQLDIHVDGRLFMSLTEGQAFRSNDNG